MAVRRPCCVGFYVILSIYVLTCFHSYVYCLGILAPYEITAASLVISYWGNPVSVGVWITIMIVVVVGLNSLPVRYYGESEFWFASMKIIMMAGLLVVSLVIFFGGGPDHDRVGFRYWQHPGAANELSAAHPIISKSSS
jgi:amino acid transporter